MFTCNLSTVIKKKRNSQESGSGLIPHRLTVHTWSTQNKHDIYIERKAYKQQAVYTTTTTPYKNNTTLFICNLEHLSYVYICIYMYMNYSQSIHSIIGITKHTQSKQYLQRKAYIFITNNDAAQTHIYTVAYKHKTNDYVPTSPLYLPSDS